MPVRRIGLCYRSVSGRVPMGAGRRGVAVESTLERDFALLQRFDLAVAQVEEQPIRITFACGTYVPDFLVTYHDKRLPAKLVEVKYSTDPALVAGDLDERFDAARAYARQRGWTFTVATELDIRTPRLANATFLLPFRGRSVAPDLRTALVNTLSRIGFAPIAVAVDEVAAAQGLAPEAVLPGLWTMLARFDLIADLDHPLTMHSRISVPDGGKP